MTTGQPTPVASGSIVAVVPTYNSAKWLEGCIGSLLDQTRPPHVIVVVDNGSDDETLDIVRRQWPEVRCIALGRNVGYGHAVNIGATQCAGHVLACNADVVLEASCLEKLSKGLADAPDVGLIGPRLIDGDGALQRSLYAFPTLSRLAAESLFLDRLPVVGRAVTYQRRGDAHNAPTDVDWLPGAVLLIRREAWDHVGGFDPGYFFFAEEVDIQARLHGAGWRRRFVPTACARHFGGKKPLAPELFLHSHLGLERYFARQGGACAGWAARSILLVTALTRWVPWGLLSLRRAPGAATDWRAMFGGVLRLSALELAGRVRRAACARVRRGTSRGAG